jgi:hypothetical protein
MPADKAAPARPLAAALYVLTGAVASVREQIAAFLAGSETVFLETGGSLETLRDQAVSLVATSAAVVDGARAGDDDPVERLAQGCRQMDLHLAASRRSLDGKAQKLRGILAAVDRLNAFRHLFRRAASALRMLGMSTSIENARAGMESTGFATVASDVRRLGGLVETRFEGVLDESLAMKRTAEAALVRVNDLAGRQGQRASAMLEDATAGLESLRALARSASAVGARAIDASNRVVESVNSVVVSLQVHDITRQMMEHTLDGLREIDADLAGVAGDEVRDEVRGVPAVEVNPVEVVELCRLQSCQLQEARFRLEAALQAIPTNLRVMSAAARELADETCRLGERPQGGSLLEAVEAGVAHATSALREQLRQEMEIERAMDQVTSTITEMLKRLRDVERIGKDLKIIGLNAGIEAVKTTQGARVLTVLARAIQELSTEVGDQTAAFAGMVHQIAAEARSSPEALVGATHLVDAGTADTGAAILDGQRIAEELESLLANLRSYNGALGDAIGVLARVGGSLGRGVEEISGKIAQQEQGIAVLEAAEARLEAASLAVLDLAGASAGGGPRAPMGMPAMVEMMPMVNLVPRTW